MCGMRGGGAEFRQSHGRYDDVLSREITASMFKADSSPLSHEESAVDINGLAGDVL